MIEHYAARLDAGTCYHLWCVAHALEFLRGTPWRKRGSYPW